MYLETDNGTFSQYFIIFRQEMWAKFTHSIYTTYLWYRYARLQQQMDVSLHPALVKRIGILNRSFSLIDQYSIVLQVQVHSVVWLVKKSIHTYTIIFAAGTSAGQLDSVTDSPLAHLPSVLCSCKISTISQILQD